MKIKSLLFIFSVTFHCITFSQVGVNTTTPAAQLEIAASSLSSPSNIDGLIIPRVNVFPSTGLTSAQQSMMVYLTTTVGTSAPGFYYYDQTPTTPVWRPLGSVTGWSLTGNSGTTPGTNFIGTTDDKDLFFKRNGIIAGFIGETNTAFGDQTLSKRTSTLTGINNTAMGRWALRLNASGEGNTAVGMFSLRQNVSGSFNTGLGLNSLYNSTGSHNTAIGCKALYYNVLGERNTFVGYQAGLSASGSNNVVLGYEAGLSASGNNNIALGYHALSASSSGSNNIAIGYETQVPSSTASNQISIGNANITIATTTVAWNSTSDKRLKNTIQNSRLGLDFLKTLNPVSYIRNNDESKKTEYGFLAQEIEQALLKFGDANNGIINIDDNGFYSVRYNDFISISIKAIQEQQAIIENDKKEIEKLNKEIAELKSRFLAVEKAILKSNSEFAENK